ncbi:GntR family transcriptional regulator [Rhizobium sp. SGZ-381]|uniref:GntR family transcriptional regulator n=1 Tax=Rhizobium sp. SGZ-381 TaxID=3342800 RepID=UPI00367244A6
MEVEKSRSIPKAEQIYWLLREAIVHLEMQPGAVVSEKDLCAELGVSRTPVREALQKLADEGLVDIFPHSGTYVSRISFKVAEEGFVIRRALEIESVRKAVVNVTDADVEHLKNLVREMQSILDSHQLEKYLDCDDLFHGAIAGISGYPRIWKFITLAKVHLDRMRQLSAPVPGHLAMVTEQHDTIVRALANRNADQAELAMRIHLDTSFAVMARMYEEQGALFDGEE